MKLQPSFAVLLSSLLPFAFLTAACSGSEDDNTDGTGGATSSAGGTGGGDPGAGESWDGKTYVLAVPAENWVRPQGIGGEIGPHVPPFAISIGACAAGTCSVTLGTANDDGTGVYAQQMCTATVATTAAATPPTFQLGPVDFPMYIVNTAVQGVAVYATAHDLTIKDVLPGSTAAVAPGSLTAVVDVRELAPMFTQIAKESRNPDGLCTQLAQFGSPCEICSFDQKAYCLTLEAVQLAASHAPNLTLQPVVVGAPSAQCPTTPNL